MNIIKLLKTYIFLLFIHFIFVVPLMAQQDSTRIKRNTKKLAQTVEPKKLLLHKMDPDNFNFGVGLDMNFNLLGNQFSNYSGKTMGRMSVFFTKPISKYYHNSFISLWDFAIEPIAINFIGSRETVKDNQYGGYYFDPSFALHLIPDRSSSDLRIMFGIRPSYLMYSYSEVLENGEYRLLQSGLESNKNKAGNLDFSGMFGISLKFSRIGNFDIKYIHSFTNRNTSTYIYGKPNMLEFGVRLSAIQIGKTLFDIDMETQKQVLKLSAGTLLIMLPTPNQNEIKALENLGKTPLIKDLYYQQELTNNIVIEKFMTDYKFSNVLFFMDTMIGKIMLKNFENVFIDKNNQIINTPQNFDSSNYFIASFCEDVSEFANRFTYGLHVYDTKMQSLPKPFNTARNDMGLFPGGDIIAYMRKKRALFNIGEYETVIKKFNDRLMKKKIENKDWE